MRLHPPLHLQELVSKSIIDEALESNQDSVRRVKTHIGNTAHVLSAKNVLYIPELGLQILDGGFVPAEGIVDSWNLGHLQRQFDRGDHPATEAEYFSSYFPTKYIAEDVCILSNMFSVNFSHFTEELLKGIHSRAGRLLWPVRVYDVAAIRWGVLGRAGSGQATIDAGHLRTLRLPVGSVHDEPQFRGSQQMPRHIL